MTNVVKHFKWRRAPSGKKRIHPKPDRGEVEACRPWLEAEVGRIRPALIVCLGATAAQALLGRADVAGAAPSAGCDICRDGGHMTM